MDEAFGMSSNEQTGSRRGKRRISPLRMKQALHLLHQWLIQEVPGTSPKEPREQLLRDTNN